MLYNINERVIITVFLYLLSLHLLMLLVFVLIRKSFHHLFQYDLNN